MGPCNKSPVQDAQVFVVASTVYGDGRPRLGCISASPVSKCYSCWITVFVSISTLDFRWVYFTTTSEICLHESFPSILPLMLSKNVGLVSALSLISMKLHPSASRKKGFFDGKKIMISSISSKSGTAPT